MREVKEGLGLMQNATLPSSEDEGAKTLNKVSDTECETLLHELL